MARARTNPHIDAGYSVGRCIVKHITERALLVTLPDTTEKWVPKSQLHPSSELQEYALIGEDGELVITNWLQSRWAAE